MSRNIFYLPDWKLLIVFYTHIHIHTHTHFTHTHTYTHTHTTHTPHTHIAWGSSPSFGLKFRLSGWCTLSGSLQIFLLRSCVVAKLRSCEVAKTEVLFGTSAQTLDPKPMDVGWGERGIATYTCFVCFSFSVRVLRCDFNWSVLLCRSTWLKNVQFRFVALLLFH